MLKTIRFGKYLTTSLIGLCLSSFAQDHRARMMEDYSSGSQSQSAPTSRPVVDRPAEADLQMYLEILDAREKTLQAANDALLREADFSIVKIPLFVAKAAMDGYFLGRILGVGKAAAAVTAADGAVAVAAQTLPKRAAQWLSSGGLERLKSLGFNIGIIGISATNNTLLLPGYRWQYGIPLYGTAYTAYMWSDQLMKSSELIEQNGREILKIRKEKFRVRAALENNR